MHCAPNASKSLVKSATYGETRAINVALSLQPKRNRVKRHIPTILNTAVAVVALVTAVTVDRRYSA